MVPYYEEDGITIYHGDCRDILPQLPNVDLVLTDPPYGVELKGKRTKHASSLQNVGYTSISDDPAYVEEAIVPLIAACIGLYGRVVVTPGTRNLHLYPKAEDIGCAFYANGAGRGRWGFNCFNPILYYGKDPYLTQGLGSMPNSFSDTRAAEPNGHPCPKPLYWILWMVKRCSFEGETILDPFMGSGTTLVAAKRLGRKAIGIEIEEKYCEIAVGRLRQSVLPLCEPAEATPESQYSII